jgi:hypothetical protein
LGVGTALAHRPGNAAIVAADDHRARRDCFANTARIDGHFDAADSWRGLLNTLALFRRLALETAKSLGYTYPGGVDRNIGGFILRLHAEETERAHHRSTPD